jgi:hypothetical protein
MKTPLKALGLSLMLAFGALTLNAVVQPALAQRCAVVVRPRPVYYAARPVYYAPRPVYVAHRPVVVVRPAPVVVVRPYRHAYRPARRVVVVR